MTTTPRAVMTPQVADDPVALRIRTLRLSQGLSYKRLSEAAGGLATSFLFNIEHGRKVPGEDVAARIAVALGDGAYEQLYRAWARVKSRGRNGRADHEAMLGAWERLRAGFVVTDNGAGTPERKIDVVDGARDAGRLRVAVLATAADPGDSVRPGPELVVNTLSLDPSLYGLDAEQAARAPGLPAGYLAVVTRETGELPRRDAAYVVRVNGRLEVVPGSALAAGSAPEPLRASGLTDASALRGALVGRIDLLLPDVRR